MGTALIFKDRKEKQCDASNVHDLLVDTIILYLLNVNVRLIKNVKVEDVSSRLAEYRKKGTLHEETEPIVKYLMENKLKDQHKEIEKSEFADIVGTWLQSYHSTMGIL